MLLLIGISWCTSSFATGGTQTMHTMVYQFRRQMGGIGVVRVGICAVAVVVLMLLIFAQQSAAQSAGATLQDTNQRSLIKPVDRSLTPTGKKDVQKLKRAPHSLIRKSQSTASATLQPNQLDAPKSTSSSTTFSTSALNDTTTQSKDTSVSSKTGTVATPSLTPLARTSTTVTTTSTTVAPNTTAPPSSISGTATFAGATNAAPSTNTSNGRNAPAPGRSKSRLASEMPGLSQLVNPSSSSSSSPPATAPPAISASPTSLSFTAQQGGSNPAAQTVSISNTGGGTLSWTASDNAAWLTVSPSAGTGNGAVTLSATTGTLTAGSYSGTVTLSATGATPVS